jgi:tetratricopeptide (TPR) repeat protein
MKKALFIALLFVCNVSFAESLNEVLNNIELTWAKAYYEQPKDRQATVYNELLDKLAQLDKTHPNDAKIIYWQGLITASLAAHQNPVTALDAIHQVRDLLNKAIAINPKVMNGEAYVVLGTLYDKTPPWPIAFGDDALAKKMLQTALQINPNSVTNNYFYGEYLLDHDDNLAAKHYFEKALAVAERTEQPYPDHQLKRKAQLALAQLP